MPRKGHGQDRSHPSKAAETETDRIIDTGIDAVNTLRTVMREVGLLACADALDQAFACCLRDYVARQDQKRINQAEEPDPGKRVN